MKNRDVNRMQKALRLSRRRIIGVKFLYFKHEYEELDVEAYGRKTSFCLMVKNAMDGEHFKAALEHFGCRCPIEALGLDEEMDCMPSGQRYYSLKLHESRAVAKAVSDDIARIPQKIYAIEIGPLDLMEDADVVIMMMNAYQLMRVVQGYAYKWSMPKNLRMAGNQGVCADLCARPFLVNDLNLSVLCAGTRRVCGWGDDEMGVGLPIQMFEPLTEGVIQTMNYIDYPNHKAEIRDSLDDPEELGVIVDDNLHYGKEGKAYIRPSLYEQLKKGEIREDD